MTKKDFKKKRKKKKNRAIYKIDEFLNDIAKEKSKGYYSDFRELQRQLRDFNELELELINNRLNLDKNTKIFNWIKNASGDDFKFIEFILASFYFDINRVDNQGNSLFYHLFTNEDIPYIHNKERFLKSLFSKGQQFNENDKVILKAYLVNNNHNDFYNEYQTLYTIANSAPKWLIEKLFESRTTKVSLIIESFLQKRLIGFRYSPNEWLRLADNSIQHYLEYWTYILSAIKYSNLYNEILKGNLKKKITHFSFLTQKEDKDFNQLFMHLYPQLIYI